MMKNSRQFVIQNELCGMAWFNTPEHLYEDFKATKLLLNPPFSYSENGMPFIAFGLDKMETGGLGAIIIQDSAGSGKATKTNQAILKKHTLIASIKMPVDLFQPMAGVQTSIYIFEAHKPHDIEQTVKFIDFRNDGHKRTSRSTLEISEPTKRYSDIIKIYKGGKNAKIEAEWNLSKEYIEDFISLSGADWNFEQHELIDFSINASDFKLGLADTLEFEANQLIKKYKKSNQPSLEKKLEKLSNESSVVWVTYKIRDLFEISNTSGFNKSDLSSGSDFDYVTRTSQNQGILQVTGGVLNEHPNPSGTWSLGLLQMDFFYRKRNWYAGQFVRIVTPKILLDEKSVLFFTAIFNKQKQNLLSGLVRDVDKKFLDSDILLPTKDEEIDFEYIGKFINIVVQDHLETLNRNHEALISAFKEVTKWA